MLTDSFGDRNSELSIRLDAARYYLSKSLKNSTKQQVWTISYHFMKEKDGHGTYRSLLNLELIVRPRVWCLAGFLSKKRIGRVWSQHEQLAACLSLVMMRDKSYSKVVMLSAAVANEYRIRMLPSPTTHETISTLFRGFRNEHPQTRTAKLPITEEILDKFYNYQTKHGRDGLRASVVLWRTIWRISMEYHTLGRFSGIVKLRRSDVKYFTDPSPHLRILFKGAKNDL